MSSDNLHFVPDPSWDAANIDVSLIDVSRWEGRQKYVKVLTNILTKKECDDLIRYSEAKGYELAKVNIGYKEVVMTDVRNNDRSIIDSPITTEFIWQRLLHVCGDDPNLLRAQFAFEGESTLHAVGLNERMRFLRYDPGTYFAPHGDGYYERGREAGEREGERSYVTFQLYLNDGFEGGATRISDFSDEEDGFDVVPQAGSVLLFQHNVFHEGSKLINGRKYAIRSDVMYTEFGPGHEYSIKPITTQSRN